MQLTLLLKTFRPPFLILSPICIFLGVSASIYEGHTFDSFLLILILLGALCAHISVNTLNEYLDFTSGLDLHTTKTSFSGGSGTLPSHPELARTVLNIGIITILITITIGIYLVYLRGFSILPYGLIGIVLIATYTTWLNRSPFLCLIAPGLGFGPLMVVGTYVILNGRTSILVWLVSLVPFFLLNNLLLLNQYPDRKADENSGRKTLPIVYGLTFSSIVYTLFMLISYGLILFLCLIGYFPRTSIIALAPMVAAVFALYGAFKYSQDLASHPQYLAANVMAALLTPLLFGISLLYV